MSFLKFYFGFSFFWLKHWEELKVVKIRTKFDWLCLILLGNYAAFQRLYGAPSYMGAWPYAAAAAAASGQGPPGAPPSAADLYYRQAAAAAALQKPLPYRLYPGMPTLGALGGSLGGIPAPATPFSHLSASSSLSSLSNYYQNSANNNGSLNGSNANGNGATNGGSSDHSPRRTPSPPLNPGSPPAKRAQSIPPSDDEDSTINV